MRTLLLTALTVLVGCASGQWGTTVDGIRLQAQVDPANAGNVELTLENGSSQAISYNLCTSALERSTNGGWTAVPEDRVCTMELRSLAPGETATFTATLPAGAPSGEYRYSANVEREAGGRVTVSSNSFLVGG